MPLSTRIKICGILCLLPAVLVAIRLFYMQTFRYTELTAKAEKRVYTHTAHDTLRGRILDRNGVVLAESLRTYAVAVSKRNVNDKDALFSAFSEILRINKKELNKLWDVKGNFFYVKKQVTPIEYESLEARLRAARILGVEIEPEYTRIYPFDGIAQDIIGAANSKNKGLSGIELMYNKELSEDKESVRVKRARRGGIIYDKNLSTEAEISDVYLTIDALGQYYAESTLKKYALEHKVKNAFVLVQDSRTGFILAAASYPARDGRSLPFQLSYEPGSTFKSIVVASALDSGSIKASDKISIENNRWTLDGITIKDHQKEPYLSVSEILEVSSNIGTAKIAHGVGAKTLYSYVKKFGFGDKSNIAFLGEPGGILREYIRWKPIDTAKAGYGYTVSVTGVQLVGAYSALANGGNLMQAHLVDRIGFADGTEKVIAKPNKIRKVIEPQTAAEMNRLLQNVVKKGTGRPARINGYTVAGKTGTTEKMADDGKYLSTAHIASFCGFVPASNPRFTILVVMDEPEQALFGGSSAKIFSDIAVKFLTLYSVPPDNEEK